MVEEREGLLFGFVLLCFVLFCFVFVTYMMVGEDEDRQEVPSWCSKMEMVPISIPSQEERSQELLLPSESF